MNQNNIKMDNLHKMTLNELTELKMQIDYMIKMKQPTLQEGQLCTVDHDKVRGLLGEIVKVNRTKCKVTFKGQHGIWNIPKSMIILGHPDGDGMQC